MIRRIIALFLASALCILLTGCWDYRSLDTLDIVSGVAIDKDLASGRYLLTFEIIDTQASGKNGDVITKYVESEGETFFDAIRQSKRRLINQLFGGNMQTLIISWQIAETEGVDLILEEIQREGETRETMCIIISQEETAKEILLTAGLDSKIIAYELYDMISEDNKLTASTKNISLYKAYNAIHGTGNALVLPVIHTIKNNEQIVAESNGIAIFEKDYLIGFEPPDNTILYLFFVDEIRGGALSFPINDVDRPVSLEIKNSKTKTKVTLDEGGLLIRININLDVNITEIKYQKDLSDLEQRDELETRTTQILEKRMRDFFSHTQETIGVDIFGFGRYIYQQDPDLWRTIENDWDSWFKNATLIVEMKTNILTSGVIKEY